MRISKGGGFSQIDHPLDTANKYLSHLFVESPDIKNIYDAVVSLDHAGRAVLPLPKWFEGVNADFRYQLTSIGTPGSNLHVAREIRNNHFGLGCGSPGAKVSWQVTGIRRDTQAQVHRVPVESMRGSSERDKFLHPKVLGRGKEHGIGNEWLLNSRWRQEMSQWRRPLASEEGQAPGR